MSELVEVEIEVTEADIKGATQNHLKHNPVARALTRTLGQWASVGHSGFTLPSLRQDFPLPRAAIYHADCYDQTGKMKPFKFKVRIPASLVLRSGESEVKGHN